MSPFPQPVQYDHPSTVELTLPPCLPYRTPPPRPHSKAKINFSAAKEVESGEQIYVFYAEEFSVGIKTMRKCVPTLRGLSVPVVQPDCADIVVLSSRCAGIAQVHRHSRIPKIPARDPDLQDEHDPFSEQGPSRISLLEKQKHP